MKKCIIPVLLLFVLHVNSYSQSEEKKPLLKMSDGQLISHPVKIFVANANITERMKPRLTLIGLKKIKYNSQGEAYLKNTFTPKTVADNQTASYEVEDTPITFTGTIMLFNFQDKTLDMSFYETGIRVLPVLTWDSLKDSLNPKANVVVGEKEIYLGNPSGGRFLGSYTLDGTDEGFGRLFH